MVIAEDRRPTDSVITPARTREEFRANVLEYVNRAERGCVPMRHMSLRFTSQGNRLGVAFQCLLDKMSREGEIAVFRVEELNRTYVFNERRWNEIHEDPKFCWDDYIKDLRDYK